MPGQRPLHTHSWSDPALPCRRGRHLLDLPVSATVGTGGRKKGEEVGVSLPPPPGLCSSILLGLPLSGQLGRLEFSSSAFSVRRDAGFLLALTSGLPQLPLFLFSFSILLCNHVNHSLYTIQSGF